MFVPCAPKPLGLDGKLPQFAVIDTRSSELLKMIRTSQPFWSAAASPDGKFVYALSPWSAAILVIDANNFTEVRTLRAGSKPSQILVAP
jgi:DNA-binding beta-propeller fold protein YncE